MEWFGGAGRLLFPAGVAQYGCLWNHPTTLPFAPEHVGVHGHVLRIGIPAVLRVNCDLVADAISLQPLHHGVAVEGDHADPVGAFLHNGRLPGFLYAVDEPVETAAAHVHPGIHLDDAWEWVTDRPLRLRLLQRTTVSPVERIGLLRGLVMSAGKRVRGALSELSAHRRQA
jgi:hypothetical protein